MANTGVAIKWQPVERMQLETRQSSHGTPQQVALRCRIILAAFAGEDHVSICPGPLAKMKFVSSINDLAALPPGGPSWALKHTLALLPAFRRIDAG